MEMTERHYRDEKIFLAGINNNGYRLAGLLQKELQALKQHDTELLRLQLNPANPWTDDIKMQPGFDQDIIAPLIIIDDVANTGRTLFYAFKPLMSLSCHSVEVAVLVERMHKSFPVEVNYCGLKLATTMDEHIEVDLENKGKYAVKLH